MKKRIKRFYKRFMKVINRSDMKLLPGSLTFFMILALVPTLTLLTYLASVLNLSVDFIYNFLEKAFSNDVASLLLSTSTVLNPGIKLTIVLVVCYYIASNGMDSVIVCSNTIYNIKESNWLKRRFKAIGMSIILVVLLTFLLLVPVFGNTIINLITKVNLNASITNIILKVFSYLRSPIMIFILFFLIKIIYTIAPNKKIKSHNTNYGALFTTILWTIVTEIYSKYILNYASYTSFYGGLANICVLMIWFYFLSYIFVIGMALNYQKENEDLENSVNIKKEN
ncbi:MAG: YihY/virulence factor BrkB family protein [bacterium]|nr:YihY/virulence factor BrkB family protein [bacterium]